MRSIRKGYKRKAEILDDTKDDAQPVASSSSAASLPTVPASSSSSAAIQACLSATTRAKELTKSLLLQTASADVKIRTGAIKTWKTIGNELNISITTLNKCIVELLRFKEISHKEVYFSLFVLRAQGYGMEKDLVAAKRCLQKAAREGLFIATCLLKLYDAVVEDPQLSFIDNIEKRLAEQLAADIKIYKEFVKNDAILPKQIVAPINAASSSNPSSSASQNTKDEKSNPVADALARVGHFMLWDKEFITSKSPEGKEAFRRKFFEKLTEKGHAEGFYGLGIHCNNLGDRDGMMLNWNLAADLGHVHAQFEVASRCVQPHEAKEGFLKSADQGHYMSQYKVARWYRDEENVAKDYVKALDYFHRAAKQDYPPAHYSISKFYARGVSVVQSDAKALEHLMLAADNSDFDAHPEALYKLGIRYLEARGVQQDYQKAIALLESAINHEIADICDAYLALATCYNLGLKDPDKVIFYLKLAVERNHGGACHHLANVYALNQDFAEAAIYYKKAIELGVKEAEGPYKKAVIAANQKLTAPVGTAPLFVAPEQKANENTATASSSSAVATAAQTNVKK